MFKYSITKKQVYALVLESKKNTYNSRQKVYTVKKIISKRLHKIAKYFKG